MTLPAPPPIHAEAPVPSSRSLTAEADALLARADWKALEAIAVRFTGAHPKEGKAWGYLGIALANQERASEAERAFEQGTAADPGFLGNWYNLALARAHAPTSGGAIAPCLDRLAELAPEKALALQADPSVRAALAPPPADIVELGRKAFEDHPHPVWKHVPPYPKAAKQARIQGSVWIDMLVDKAGRVIQLDQATGPKELVDAARYCAVQFRFPPLLREGAPRPYRMTYEIPFKLRTETELSFEPLP